MFIGYLAEIPYRIINLFTGIIETPIKYIRQMIDICINPIFMLLLPIRYVFNLSGGFIYNLYHGTLGRPQRWLVGLISALPGKKGYNWMSWCTMSRLLLPVATAFKSIHKLLLLVPICGWILWIVTLPILFYLKLIQLWVIVCPIRNVEAFMAPTTFPKHQTCPGCYDCPI